MADFRCLMTSFYIHDGGFTFRNKTMYMIIEALSLQMHGRIRFFNGTIILKASCGVLQRRNVHDASRTVHRLFHGRVTQTSFKNVNSIFWMKKIKANDYWKNKVEDIRRDGFLGCCKAPATASRVICHASEDKCLKTEKSSFSLDNMPP